MATSRRIVASLQRSSSRADATAKVGLEDSRRCRQDERQQRFRLAIPPYVTRRARSTHLRDRRPPAGALSRDGVLPTGRVVKVNLTSRIHALQGALRRPPRSGTQALHLPALPIGVILATL